MSTTPGSWVLATGLAILLLSVSVGMNVSDVGFGLLSFVGVLAGVSTIAVGVRTADDPAPIAPAVFQGARALAAFLRRHHTSVGLVLASSAVTAVSGDAGHGICFVMFAVFLLGISLINIGALGGE